MKDIKFEVLNKVGRFSSKIKDLPKISAIDGVSPPSVFVGSKLKYPEVNVGILSPIERVEGAEIFDNPETWAKENFSISEVLRLRSNLVNSRFRSNVKDVRTKNKFIDVSKEIAIASKPVDIEIKLKNKINLDKKRDRVLTPSGMRVGLSKIDVVSNVKIDQKVDKAINDEIKSVEGLNFLYSSGINEYSLSKILSVGALGIKKNKRMVPTRWSITATDDMLSKILLKKVRDYPWIEDYGLFFGEFLGNQYLILLFPNIWNFELFELYYPGSSWNPSTEMKASTDYEGFWGRKTYASNCAGGYYATRFPLLEYLDSIKKQAGILVIRLETPSYWAGLGVWVVRESVRKAIERGFMKFESKEELLNATKQIAKMKYGFDFDLIIQKSKLIKSYGVQKNLKEWF